MRTVLDSLRKVRDEPTQANQIYAEVLEVDHVGKQLRVQIGGVAQWVACAYPLVESIGTKENKTLVAGGTVLLARWYNDAEYVAVVYRSPKQSRAASRRSRLTAPVWNSGYPRVVGTDIHGAWGIVTGAVRYEVWRNSTPSANGAELFASIPTNSIIQPVGLGRSSELLINGGFESGDFTGWQVGSPPLWTVQSSVKHTLNYAAKLDSTTMGPLTDPIASDRFGVVESTDYVFSLYLRCDEWSDPVNSVGFTVYWLDNDYVALSNDAIYRDNPTVDSTFHLITNTITSPIGARYAYVVIDHSFGTSPGDFLIYVDDVSVVGPSEPNPANLLYAVRAVDANGNASPFSAWLKPLAQSAVMGTVQLVPDIGLTAAAAADQSASKVFATDGSIVTLTGGSASAWSETPSGTINGVNVSFALAHAPVSGSLRLYLNGLRLRDGASNDYTLSENTITMNTPPTSGDWLLADYVY